LWAGHDGSAGQVVGFAEAGLNGSLRLDLEPYLSTQTTRGVDAHFGAPAMRTGLSVYPLRAPTSFGRAAPFAPGARAARAVTLATPQSEGLVRVRGRVCLRTLRPRPLGVASGAAIRPGSVGERRFEAAEDLPADRLADGLCGIAVQDPDAPDRRAVGPSRTGLLAGSDPAAEGRMAVYIAILPDADRAMPNRGVTPSHGLDGRIGIAASAVVAQPKAWQRHAGPASCTSGVRFPCTSTPTWDVHSWIGIGNVENRLRFMALRIDIGKLRDGGRTRRRRVDSRRDPTPRTSRLAEAASLRELSFAQIVQSVNREESNDGTHETKPPDLLDIQRNPMQLLELQSVFRMCLPHSLPLQERESNRLHWRALDP